MESQNELINKVCDEIMKKIIIHNRKKAINKFAKIEEYQINYFLINYLCKFFGEDVNPETLSKALYYPKVLGTSLTTSFGTNIQKLLVNLNLAKGSLCDGIDIEYKDKITNKKVFCQVKAGPNTINSGNVAPIKKKFEKLINLGRTNDEFINNYQCIVGLIYGSEDQISQHYKRIDETYAVYSAEKFWHSITGYDDFYFSLINEIDLRTKNELSDFSEDSEKALKMLERNIEQSLEYQYIKKNLKN